MLEGPEAANPSTPMTNMLYTGEEFDTDAQQYYLRARYYNPLNGRFNRMDPYAGIPTTRRAFLHWNQGLNMIKYYGCI